MFGLLGDSLYSKTIIMIIIKFVGARTNISISLGVSLARSSVITL